MVGYDRVETRSGGDIGGRVREGRLEMMNVIVHADAT